MRSTLHFKTRFYQHSERSKMKRWILLARVEPQNDVTVMMRHGASVTDGFYSRLLQQWFALVPGGGAEKISAPDMLWLDEEYARKHPRKFSPADDIILSRSKT